MNLIDWLVVAASCSLVFAVGLMFARRSSKKGAAGYFAGDRDVPWWAIGLSNTATYSSGTGAFVMLVLVFGLAGNWLWWTSWIVWMPLVAIVWARLWRRMQIVTTAELISLRYGGTPSLVARKVYAFVCCFGFAVLIISYITGFFAKTIAPLCPLTTLQVLLIFGGITVVYTMFGGLLGVVYADVVQFGIMITGCTVFFVLAVTHHGGWHEILHRVREIRPAGLLQTPPSPFHRRPDAGGAVLAGLVFRGVAHGRGRHDRPTVHGGEKRAACRWRTAFQCLSRLVIPHAAADWPGHRRHVAVLDFGPAGKAGRRPGRHDSPEGPGLCLGRADQTLQPAARLHRPARLGGSGGLHGIAQFAHQLGRQLRRQRPHARPIRQGARTRSGSAA